MGRRSRREAATKIADIFNKRPLGHLVTCARFKGDFDGYVYLHSPFRSATLDQEYPWFIVFFGHRFFLSIRLAMFWGTRRAKKGAIRDWKIRNLVAESIAGRSKTRNLLQRGTKARRSMSIDARAISTLRAEWVTRRFRVKAGAPREDSGGRLGWENCGPCWSDKKLLFPLRRALNCKSPANDDRAARLKIVSLDQAGAFGVC